MADYLRRTKDYFSGLIGAHGESLRVVDWGSETGQRQRFELLYEAGLENCGSILDVGCGRGDFLAFLNGKGFKGGYTGVDITPGMITIAQKHYPKGIFEERDVLAKPYGTAAFDAVIASGIFYLEIDDNEAFAEKMIAALYGMAGKILAFNMLSARAEKKDDGEYYFGPEKVLAFCQTLTPYVTLRHDYRTNDFTVYLFRKSP